MEFLLGKGELSSLSIITTEGFMFYEFVCKCGSFELHFSTESLFSYVFLFLKSQNFVNFGDQASFNNALDVHPIQRVLVSLP